MKNKNKKKRQLCKQNVSQQQKNNNQDSQINLPLRSVVEQMDNIEQQQQKQKQISFDINKQYGQIGVT